MGATMNTSDDTSATDAPLADSSPASEQNQATVHEDTSPATSDETSATGESTQTVAPETIPKSRFNEVYYQKSAAERRAHDLEQQLQQIQQQIQPEQGQAYEAGKPTLEQFDYDDAKFNEALLDWKLDQRDAQVRQREELQKKQALVNDFKSKQTDYLLKNQDYADLANRADYSGVRISDELAQALMSSERGVEVHHHLLANPTELDRLNGQSGYGLARAVFALENKFSQPKPQVSQAPEPINPVSGSGANVDKSLDQLSKMSPKEYYDYQMAKREPKRR